MAPFWSPARPPKKREGHIGPSQKILRCCCFSCLHWMAHRIHGTNGIFTYMYHKNQQNAFPPRIWLKGFYPMIYIHPIKSPISLLKDWFMSHHHFLDHQGRHGKTCEQKLMFTKPEEWTPSTASPGDSKNLPLSTRGIRKYQGDKPSGEFVGWGPRVQRGPPSWEIPNCKPYIVGIYGL